MHKDSHIVIAGGAPMGSPLLLLTAAIACAIGAAPTAMAFVATMNLGLMALFLLFMGGMVLFAIAADSLAEEQREWREDHNTH